MGDYMAKTQPQVYGFITNSGFFKSFGIILASVGVNANKTPSEETDKTDETPDSASKTITVDSNKAPEDMTVEELQLSILAKMAKNGPVTDQMKKTVYDNIWHDSLVNWMKSFH